MKIAFLMTSLWNVSCMLQMPHENSSSFSFLFLGSIEYLLHLVTCNAGTVSEMALPVKSSQVVSSENELN
jgi:hypothetical protein